MTFPVLIRSQVDIPKVTTTYVISPEVTTKGVTNLGTPEGSVDCNTNLLLEVN